jgi:hypothetical protein
LQRISLDQVAVVNLRFDAVLAKIAPLGRHKFCICARFFDRFQARDDSDPAAASMAQPLLAWLSVSAEQTGVGRRPAVPQAALLSRWVRILSITIGSSMQAMLLTGPPQLLQISMSMLKTRFKRCA